MTLFRFGMQVSNVTDAEGNQRFPQYLQIWHCRSMLSLPSSNASVERLLSAKNVVHRKLRNRLHVP
jgi:hypothetical protein